MKAMIFAAGLGTRLGDLTRSIPKALVEVGGHPMLERVILKLKSVGITSMVINIHHHAEMIESYLASNDNFGCDIKISDERDMLLDTGGGLLKAKPLLAETEPILLHNADILTDFDIRKMIETHLSEENDVTLLVDDRKTSRYLLFDNGMRMKGWTDVRTGEIRSPYSDLGDSLISQYAFGGVHIINPTAVFPLLEVFSREPKFSITPFYTAECNRLKIYGYKPAEPYHWIDIGKPDTLSLAQSIASEL